MNNINYLKGQLSKLMENKNLDFVNQFYKDENIFDTNLYHNWYFLSLDFLNEYESKRLNEFRYYYEKEYDGIYDSICNNQNIDTDKFKNFIVIQSKIIEYYLSYNKAPDTKLIFNYETPTEFSEYIIEPYDNRKNLINYLDWFNEAFKYLEKYNLDKALYFAKYYFNMSKMQQDKVLSDILLIETKEKNSLSDVIKSRAIFLLETQYTYLQVYKEKIDKNNSELINHQKYMRKRNSIKVISKGIDN